MYESFELPVFYNGKELLFSSRLIMTGYTYKIQVDVYGQEVQFEPDEERVLRALIQPEELEKGKAADVHLLQAIAAALEAIGNN